MLLKDYLDITTHGRRILIVSDLARGQALIRMHEKKTGVMVRNVTCMTIAQMTDMLYRYILAEDGYNEEYEFLDSTEAMMLFRGVLFKNIKSLHYFNNEKMMDLATTYEIFRKANLVRTNGWTGEEKKKKNARVSDLKLLISEYEEKLEADKKMDMISKEKLVIDRIRSFSSLSEEIRDVFSAEIAYLKEDTIAFNGLELDILSLLCNAMDSDISAFSDDLSVEKLSNCAGKVTFYKGYGSFNEANYIVNDILEKGLPLGGVTVLYSSANQLPAITAALRGNGIKMDVVSTYPAKDNAYISLAKRMIEWAKAGYSEKALDAILASPIICVQVEDGSGSKSNAISGQKYFDHILDARNRREDGFVLGWGYDRNKDFIKHESGIATEDSVKEILKMHEALLGVFGEKGKPYSDTNKVRPIVIYEKIAAFIEEYTSGAADYAVGVDGIRRLFGAVRLEERVLPLDEALDFIGELLSEIKVSDTEENTAVKVQSMGEWSLLDRPYVYVIGLALKDMQSSMTESPVLFDDELEAYLSKGYVPTIKNEAERRERNLLYSISSFDGEHIVFGYSDYDTVNFYENNASAFFREALSAFSSDSIKGLPEFVYGNPTGGTGSSTLPAWKDKASYDIRLTTSNSSLEVLLDCPKKYAYDKIMYVPDNEFTECDYGRWLDARLKGSFFHGIVEEYCNTKMVKKATESYETAVDVDLVEKIAKKIEETLLLEAPCAFRKLADRETDDMIEEAAKYLQKLLDELNSSDWRVLKAEQKFSEASYPVKGFDGKDYDFVFSGSIDRVDYRVDKAEKKCFLRIIDYKTGKRERKANEDALGKLVQYAIYKKALMDTGKVKDKTSVVASLPDYIKGVIAELEEDATVKTFDLEFESFQYVFPLDKKTEEPIEIVESELEGINLVRLRSILAILESKHMYPDHKELVESLVELVTDYPADADDINVLLGILTDNEKEKENCKYCTYQYLCAHRKAGEI